jgi:hypothetical protein
MDEKQFSELVSKLSTEAKSEIQRHFSDAKNGYMTADQFKMEAEKLAAKEDLTKMDGLIQGVALEIKKLAEIPVKNQSLENVIEKKLIDLKDLQSKNKRSMILDLKTAVTTASVGSDTGAMRLTDIGQMPTRRVTIPSLLRVVNVSPNNHGVVRYYDQSTTTRNADAKAENVAAPESVLAWTERNLTLEKLLDSIPVSHEAITDIDFVAGEIRRFLDVNVMLKEEQQIYAGNGTAPEWKGLYTNATDYTQALAAADKVLTGGVTRASIADLIMYVATKIMNGYDGKFNANFVLVNPLDFLGLRTIKTVNGSYIIPPFMSPDGSQIGGLRVVESSLVTANTLLVGDGNLATVYQQEAFALELGWVSTQFTEDMLTLKARKRGNVLVRNVDATAIYKVTDIQTRVNDISA